MIGTRVSRLLVCVVVTAGLVGAASASATTGSVTFQDNAGDAYRVLGPAPLWPQPDQPPVAALSDEQADMVEVSLSTVTRKPNSHVYTASIRIEGTPSPDYSYVISGKFNQNCWIFHFLTPGITSKANLFCDRDTDPTGPLEFIGRLSGSAVTLEGNTVTAEYTVDNSIPPELAADRVIRDLVAFSCVSGLEGKGCRPAEVLDTAAPPEGTTFEI